MLESGNHRIPELPKQRADYQSYASNLPEGKLEAIVKAIRKLRQPIVLACSGGGDSVFLGECLRLSGAEFSVAHVNHHLRADAHYYEEFVRRLSRWWGVDCQVAHEFPVNEGAGLEAAARSSRYHALTSRCRETGGVLVTGHTASDQLETFFMRVGRGTGLFGLRGIPEWREHLDVHVYRPILDLWRDDIRRALLDAGMPWVDDPTNDSDFALRNRVRDGVSAAFRREFSATSTGRSLQLIAEEADLHRALIREKAMELTPDVAEGRLRVSTQALAGLISKPLGEAASRARTVLIRSVLAELMRMAGVPFNERLLIEIECALADERQFVAAGHGARVECDGQQIEVRRVQDPSVPFATKDARSAGEIREIRLFDIVGDGTQTIGGHLVEARRTYADSHSAGQAPRHEGGFSDYTVEYFDEARLNADATFRSLSRSDMWIAPDGKRRDAWRRAKRDGMNEAARMSGVVLAADTDVYWLLGGRRSALAWISDTTRSIIEVHVRQPDRGVETH